MGICSHLYSLVACALLHAEKVGMAGNLIHHIVWDVLSSPAHTYAQPRHDTVTKQVSRTLPQSQMLLSLQLGCSALAAGHQR